MGKFKRGGYIFRTWKGDHLPRHVHVFKNKRFIVKWNLDADTVMRGTMNSKLRRLIEQLKQKGKI